MHQVQFIIGLSNGEMITEGKGNYQRTAGEHSPWMRAIRYIAESGVKITSLSLYTADGKRWNLPSAGKNPKFKEVGEYPVPVSFNFFRKAGIDIDPDDHSQTLSDVYAVAEAQYPDGKSVQLWVNDETMSAWTFIK